MTHCLSRSARLASSALLFLIAMPALSVAAVTDWAENEGGRMRLVMSPPTGDGIRTGALEIEPLPGWITYWREPGDSGIPPQIAPDPGSPYVMSPLAFPVPKRLDTGEIRDIGYDGPVVLPFTLERAAGASEQPLNATAFIGLCRNICIPFQATFTLPLDPDPAEDAVAAAVIASAAPSMPEQPSEEFSVSKFEMAPDLSSLTVTLKLPPNSKGSPQIFVTGPSGYVFTEFEGKRSIDGGFTAVFPIAKLPRNYEINGQQWSVLAISGPRAMEAPLAFE